MPVLGIYIFTFPRSFYHLPRNFSESLKPSPFRNIRQSRTKDLLRFLRYDFNVKSFPARGEMMATPKLFVVLLTVLCALPALPTHSGEYSSPVLPTNFAGNECASEAFPPSDASRAVGWFQVNLDLPPAQRWTPLIKAKKTQMAALIAHIKTVGGK